MTKSAGRLCVVKKNGTAIAGARTNSVTANKTPIDVTDKGDGPNVALLDATLATQTLEISCEGVEDGQVLRDLGLSASEGSAFLADLTYEFANGDEITGDFFMGSYTEGAPRDDASTFSATFTSHGGWTYTPA